MEKNKIQFPRTFILIKGQPKALQIETFFIEENGVYNVKFKSSPNTYHYKANDVVWIKDSKWHDHLQCKIYIGRKEQKNIDDILSFEQGTRTHWRITYSNGYVQDYLDGSINVIESCLTDKIAESSFEYLKRVAKTNKLGKGEEHEGILSTLYEEINFIDKSLAAAPYLNNKKYKVKTFKVPTLIFPFGCNSSQEKAVTAAFTNQISIIQGPPGTGKTQTILNIIANILLQQKTVLVVSNNNSATTNILDKLQKYNFGFIAAALGKKENKERFIMEQPDIPDELQEWELNIPNSVNPKKEVIYALSILRKAFTLQDEMATLKQEIKSVELEWEHYKQDNGISDDTYIAKHGSKSSRLLNLWLQYQAHAEGDTMIPKGFWEKIKDRIKWIWLNFTRKYLLGIKSSFDKNNLQPIILELQSLYYTARLEELGNRIKDIENKLQTIDSKAYLGALTSWSMNILKDTLYKKYNGKKHPVFNNTKDLRLYAELVCEQYPVILSTTFSARTTLKNVVYDYIIMDEASQVSIETGALALTCGKNAVIVGDKLQLSNVVTEENKIRLNTIFKDYKIPQGFDCSKYNFLQSVHSVIPGVKETLLREHYRCHPKIINFCNQKFYGGNLLIMTEDNAENNVLTAIKTNPGHHCRGKYNQREIDVIKQEVLPGFSDNSEIGIITPYNAQVDKCILQLPTIETATIHKYQGREKDNIIMSIVDDKINPFSDDPNLLNVAISRAKKRFCLVVSGNEQELKGNISELIDYIEYNNFAVTESKLSSIFDYLYAQYTNERISFLTKHVHISEYDSENLTYCLIKNILQEYSEFNHLGVLCHTPLRSVIRNTSLMNSNERKYASNYNTHLDFLIINHVTKKPILAIETDGYNFHNNNTEQHKRDLMKDHILEIYNLPLLRLATTAYGEKEKIIEKLKLILSL